jgi:hypothetical protein
MKKLCACVALLAMVFGALACDRGQNASRDCPSAEPAGSPIDERVMAFLSAARALHHEADMKERGGDVDAALGALQRLVALKAPRAPESDEVLADAYARLAELRLGKNDVPGADRDVRQGLDHAAGPTYFRGHLLEVEGLIEEKRAGTLSDAGSVREAAEARARAVSLLEEAVHVQEQVIARALGDGGDDD